MLRFTDELLLLLMDDKRGDLIPMREWSLACALAGALLMDLTLEGRIDTDPDYLSLLDATPLGDDLLDPVLEEIDQADAVHHARFWVAHVARRGDKIRDKTLARLTAQGILQEEEEGVFSFSADVSLTRRYPPDEMGRDDVTLRVMRALFDRRRTRSARHRHHPPRKHLRRLRAPAHPGGAPHGSGANRPPDPPRTARPRRGRSHSAARVVGVPTPPWGPVTKAPPMPSSASCLVSAFIRRAYLTPRAHLRD